MLAKMVQSCQGSMQALSADAKWGEETLQTLHTLSKIETLEMQSVTSVAETQWPQYTNFIVQKLVRNGAKAPEQELRSELEEAAFSLDKHGRTFDISLNYEWGGSQYMSCAKFVVKKKANGTIVVAYSLFGKRWIEQSDYRLNIKFWETAPTPQKLRNFLEHGATRNLVKVLEAPDARQAIL